MRLFFLSLFFLIPAISQAQWKTSAGINIPPVIARSAEISSEFRRHPGYSLNLNFGHTFGTGHTGLINYKVYDGVSQRRTSGTFLKAGARLYPASISGKQKNNRFFLGAFLVLSKYRQTALQQKLSENFEFSDTYMPVSQKGMVLFPAATIGFQHNLARFLILDWGFQKSFVIRENNYLGRRERNYQPGAGSAQSDPFIGYLQGIVALRYQLSD
ncbi:hypothetical protein FEM33_17480 [Dyadobacter flavalbus]|uniref:DUF3575 domain-containing protein n=1 Tax=Dyadobacter flavalbus TaxID=2579942 RepID=A0A5M8QT92_9BACT|nr:hypothetical protein [Dyadobacter flavalbus]KAA6438478.1 hypothetical protein FEM33_17480 [Dyadobacter flavalbus]